MEKDGRGFPMTRPVSDWEAQKRGYHQHKQMIRAHEEEKHEHWQTNPCDTLGVEPDFPTEVFES